MGYNTTSGSGSGGPASSSDIDGGEADSVYGGTDNIDSNGGA